MKNRFNGRWWKLVHQSGTQIQIFKQDRIEVFAFSSLKHNENAITV